MSKEDFHLRGRSFTLTQKVAGMTLLLFLGAIWPLAYFTTTILQQNLGKVLADQQFVAVSAVASDLEHNLALRMEALKNEASGLPIDFLNSTFVGQHYLAHRRSLYSLFSNGVVLIGRDGSSIADYPPQPGRSHAGFKPEAYFQQVVATGKQAIGQPGISRFSGKPEVAIAVPVRAPMGDIVGILAGFIRLDDPTVFGSANAKMGLSGGYRVISPNDGFSLTGPRFDDMLKPLPLVGQNRQLDLYMRGFEGSGVSLNSSGVEELSSAKRLKNADWFVMSVLPIAEAFAPVHSMRRQIYSATALLSVLAAALMWLLMRHHLHPVVLASRHLREMISGALPLQPVAIHRDDEVGSFLSAFNELQAQIHQGALRLSENEEKFRVMFEASPVGITLNDADGVFIDANEAILRMLGYSREEFTHLSYWDITPGGYRAQEDAQIMHLGENVPYGPFEMDYLHKDGSRIPVLLSGTVVRDRSGRRLVWSLVQDMSEHMAAERNMRLAAKVFEYSGEAILISDPENRIVSVNSAFTRITGYQPMEVIGKPPSILNSGRHDQVFYDEMWMAIRHDGQWQGEVWNRRKNGEIYPEWLTITTMMDDHGNLANYIGIFSDVTERKKSEESIRHLAQHDALTDLPNRVLLSDRLSQAIAASERSGQPFALMFIDLDRFKNINDSLGHNVGDMLLQEVARRLTYSMRATDTVSRQGGDEFVILATDVDDSDAVANLAEKLIQIVSRPYHIEERDLTVTPSIGIAIFPNDGADAETLLRNADAAMYCAKNNGRNNFQFFTQDMNTRALEFLLMENDLRSALERGEFVLHYQPQVDARSGNMVGMEALVRWQHPLNGLISPGKFIPVAEESGLILPLGRWVLFEACRQNKSWQSAGYPPLPVAVNLSAIQFRSDDIVQTVREVLEETGLEARYLELEVTESAIMQGTEDVIATLINLKGMGVKLSIDDFGTGYSSLSYLKRFPIDKLKVDQSFVREIIDDASDAQICCAVISLAHSLHLLVIAEGVEHEPQLDFLRKKKCNMIQGFYVGKPVSANEFTNLLEAAVPLF